MGNGELALLLNAALTLLVGVLAFVSKEKLRKAEETERRAHELDRRLSIVEASTLHTTVADQGQRLHALETGIAKLMADLSYVKRWVERQSAPHHYRDDDTKT